MNSKWDKRFMELAKLVSTWSKDPSTKVGVVIVNSERQIISVGYNGFPRCMKDNNALYLNRDEKYSRIIHAEVNSVLNTNKSVSDCTTYFYPFAPCDRCCVFLLQAGISNFVFPKLPKNLSDRWGESVKNSKQYIRECGKTYTEINL